MDVKKRNERIRNVHHTRQAEILERKGKDYSGDSLLNDGNYNFSEIAKRLKGAPLDNITVLMIMMEKQIIALETYVRLRKLDSEDVIGRCDDIANYANLMLTLMEDPAREKILDEELREIYLQERALDEKLRENHRRKARCSSACGMTPKSGVIMESEIEESWADDG